MTKETGRVWLTNDSSFYGTSLDYLYYDGYRSKLLLTTVPWSIAYQRAHMPVAHRWFFDFILFAFYQKQPSFDGRCNIAYYLTWACTAEGANQFFFGEIVLFRSSSRVLKLSLPFYGCFPYLKMQELQVATCTWFSFASQNVHSMSVIISSCFPFQVTTLLPSLAWPDRKSVV